MAALKQEVAALKQEGPASKQEQAAMMAKIEELQRAVATKEAGPGPSDDAALLPPRPADAALPQPARIYCRRGAKSLSCHACKQNLLQPASQMCASCSARKSLRNPLVSAHPAARTANLRLHLFQPSRR